MFILYRFAPPLPRQGIFFLVIALFAGGNEVAFRRFPTAHERNEVIHSQRRGRKPLLTVMAHSRGAFAFPPFRTTEFTRFVFLALYIRSLKVGEKRLHAEYWETYDLLLM